MWVEVVKLVLLFCFTSCVSVTVGLVIIENCFKMLFWGQRAGGGCKDIFSVKIHKHLIVLK